ncbi:MAG: NTP transferase domain-containing protein [Cyclobacteriaceae bacterium]|nr:NTP transferase domain-containing protein [Cyclobacteriaceae bacterium]
MSLTLVILAAGRATRYGKLKQLEPVGPNGNAIIDYSIYDAIKAGFDEIVIITRSDILDTQKQHFTKFFSEKIPVHYVLQDIHESNFTTKNSKPLGTGHALLCTQSVIHNNFAVINADDFYGRNAFVKMAKKLNELKEIGLLASYKLKDTLSENGSVSRAVCQIDDNDNLLSISEAEKIVSNGTNIVDLKTNNVLQYDNLVSMNFWGFKPTLFKHLEESFETYTSNYSNNQNTEFYIPIVVESLIQKKETIHVFDTNEQWFGLTYMEDKDSVVQRLQQLVDKGIYPEKIVFE